MKFWNCLRWLATIVFVLFLAASWLAADPSATLGGSTDEVFRKLRANEERRGNRRERHSGLWSDVLIGMTARYSLFIVVRQPAGFAEATMCIITLSAPGPLPIARATA